jgi:hypothetical protein
MFGLNSPLQPLTDPGAQKKNEGAGQGTAAEECDRNGQPVHVGHLFPMVWWLSPAHGIGSLLTGPRGGSRATFCMRRATWALPTGFQGLLGPAAQEKPPFFHSLKDRHI